MALIVLNGALKSVRVPPPLNCPFQCPGDVSPLWNEEEEDRKAFKEPKIARAGAEELNLHSPKCGWGYWFYWRQLGMGQTQYSYAARLNRWGSLFNPLHLSQHCPIISSLFPYSLHLNDYSPFLFSTPVLSLFRASDEVSCYL